MACRVYERAPEIKELGVGITLLPHAMREFAALGLDKELFGAGIEILESCFFNRFGSSSTRSRAAPTAVINIPRSASIAAACT